MNRRLSLLLRAMLCLAIVGWPAEAMAAPANDDFAETQVLTGLPPSATGSNVDATLEEGEPDHADAGGEHSVWYRWTAPENLPLTLSLCESDFDTVLAVYEGDALGALTEVASSDDSGLCFPQSSLELSAEAGTTYQIAVDGAFGDQGNFVLEFVDRRPANDEFAHATGLNGYLATGSGSNEDATSEEGEPSAGAGSARRSVWFSWTAPAGGVAVVDSCSSNFDTLLVVYTGSSVTSLKRIGADDNECGKQSLASFFAGEGTTYRIQIDGAGDKNPTGKVRLRVRQSKTGKYSGRTEFLDRKPINFKLSVDGRSVKRLTVSTSLDCRSGGFPTGELRLEKLVFKPIPVGKGRDGGAFSRTAKIRFVGGGNLTVFVEGTFLAPEGAKGKLRSKATIPGIGTCTHFMGTLRWSAHH